ncbi:hypothetical protein BRC62_02085, partial [Halobacteriales archaeon QH_10_67_13]
QRRGGDGGTDDGGTDGGGTTGDEIQGETSFDGDAADFLTVEHSGRFEEGTVSQNLVVEGTAENTSDSSLNVEVVLEIDGYIPDERTTLAMDPGESTEFSIEYADIDAGQVGGYTLEFGFSSSPG